MIIGKSKKMVAQMSEEIDRILHGEDHVDIRLFKEGELYILQSQINKMTVRLREQAHFLKKDKAYLAQFLADIAHQLRTPMTSLNMLVSFSGNNEHSREGAELLARMDWLLTTLLKISKIDAGMAVFAEEEVSAELLIQKSAEPFSIPFELRNVALTGNWKNSEISCICDINWTAEAIGNIIKNCMEHATQINIDCSSNSIFTEIVICDNGKGIPAADLPHIFERFYQGTQGKSDNYGVGLALCKMILTQQNATIKASNNPGGGACFTIRLYKND
jgi:signal transduction histidine kinase